MKGFALSLSFESENLWNSEMACNLSTRNNGENKSIIHFFFFFSPSSDCAQKKNGKSSCMEAITLQKQKIVITLQQKNKVLKAESRTERQSSRTRKGDNAK